MDLSYAGNTVSGFVDLSVSGVNFGVGGYLIKILGEKTRLYGNAFIDLHLFDVTRDQTFVAPIEPAKTPPTFAAPATASILATSSSVVSFLGNLEHKAKAQATPAAEPTIAL